MGTELIPLPLGIAREAQLHPLARHSSVAHPVQALVPGYQPWGLEVGHVCGLCRISGSLRCEPESRSQRPHGVVFDAAVIF